jgi:hypothetical protein
MTAATLGAMKLVDAMLPHPPGQMMPRSRWMTLEKAKIGKIAPAIPMDRFRQVVRDHRRGLAVASAPIPMDPTSNAPSGRVRTAAAANMPVPIEIIRFSGEVPRIAGGDLTRKARNVAMNVARRPSG